LDIAAPLLRVQTVGLQCAAFAEVFDLVNDFVSTVVACTRVAFAVFVAQTRAEHFKDVVVREVL